MEKDTMKITKFPIDLSMLTEEEIDQFRQDPSTLLKGIPMYVYISGSALNGNGNNPLKDSSGTAEPIAN